jgi:tetratricopeptide (TPR) repeat protein
LGSVYSKNQDWEHAIESYAQVISLKPELADAYYSLAVSEENAAGTIINSSDEITPEEKKLAYDLTQKAIQDYQTYLAKAPDAKDKKEVEQSIEQLKGMFSSIEVDTGLLRRL